MKRTITDNSLSAMQWMLINIQLKTLKDPHHEDTKDTKKNIKLRDLRGELKTLC